MTNNQKEEIFSNKFIQNFLENDSKVNIQNKYKFAEIASSLAYYLKSFSNINKLLDYVCLIFKHIFSFWLFVKTNLIDKYVLTLNLSF